MRRKIFPMNLLSNGFLSIQMEQNPLKFSLYLNDNQLTIKLFSRLVFVVYGIKLQPNGLVTSIVVIPSESQAPCE